MQSGMYWQTDRGKSGREHVQVENVSSMSGINRPSEHAAEYIDSQLHYSDSSHAQNMPSKLARMKRYKARQYKFTSEHKTRLKSKYEPIKTMLYKTLESVIVIMH
jgi:hypothetical protein